MYRDIPAFGSHIREIVVETPLDDYELLDFGRGRKLERFGELVLSRPDPRAKGEPVLGEWRADWTYGCAGDREWRAARDGLPRSWELVLDGARLRCVLGAGGRIGVEPREVPCRRWIAERLGGCYDLDDMRALALFAGAGAVSEAAVRAGATVVHVDASDQRLELARSMLGERQARFEHAHVPGFVENALRRGEHFDFLSIQPPRIGHGPGSGSWDIEVDLPRMIKTMVPLVSEQCRGIWVQVDAGSWSAASVAQMLHDALPGRSVEAVSVGIATGDGRVLPAGGAALWFDDRDAVTVGPLERLRVEEVEDYLDAYLDAVLSSRRTAAGPAGRLARLERAQQDFALHWVSVVARTNAEMAYQFAEHAADALERMDEAGTEAWLIRAMDAYDNAGLYAGLSSLREVESFVRDRMARSSGLELERVQGVLEGFVHGLNGRRLRIAAGDTVYTDTETLFLPETLARFSDQDANFRLFKAMVVHQWAQTWYGTWRADVGAVVAGFDRPERALGRFHALEVLRLDACIERDLPGVYRQLSELRDAGDSVGLSSQWEEAARRLARPEATVQDSIELLASVYGASDPVATLYQGTLHPERVEAVRALRLAQDREAFRKGLVRMREDERRKPPQEQGEDAETGQETEPRGQFQLREVPDAELPDGFTYEIELDGQPVAPPDDVKGTMQSILQDLGEIPEDYLVAAGDGAYRMDGGDGGERDPSEVWKGTYHEEGAFLYNEWHHERHHYRKNWAVLRELEVHPRYDGFAEATVQKYAGLVRGLRRTFEALRGEDKLLKKQTDGDDVDIDALVEAYADTRSGMEMTDRLFTKLHKLERNIAVMFMVDMSGSTKGWINEAQRESLVLLCEALETLGDRYAIYGFSGMTRKRCEVYRVKRFNEPYDADARARISGITPQDYTRMGVTIRHLTRLLSEVDARTKLLITLSDGKPDDYDGYRGAYGIEDTRQALIEAKQAGVHPFCITIDTEAKDYLPHMYGAVNYTVIDEVRKLPLKVSDIYRRLTT